MRTLLTVVLGWIAVSVVVSPVIGLWLRRASLAHAPTPLADDSVRSSPDVPITSLPRGIEGCPSRVDVVVVSDHELMRQGMRGLLSTADDLRVEALSGSAAALNGLRFADPAVAVVDLHPPAQDASRIIAAVARTTPLVVLVDDESDPPPYVSPAAAPRVLFGRERDLPELLAVIRHLAATPTRTSAHPVPAA